MSSEFELKIRPINDSNASEWIATIHLYYVYMLLNRIRKEINLNLTLNKYEKPYMIVTLLRNYQDYSESVSEYQLYYII